MKKKNKQLSIGKVINTLLSDKYRIFPLIADEGAKFPFIIYKRTASNKTNTKDCIYSRTAVIEMIVASDKYAESIEISENVVDILENVRGSIAGFNICKIELTNSAESFAEDAKLQLLQFEIEYEK